MVVSNVVERLGDTQADGKVRERGDVGIEPAVQKAPAKTGAFFLGPQRRIVR